LVGLTGSNQGTIIASNDPPTDARAAALRAVSQILRRHQPLDEALMLDGIKDARDRAFAHLLTVTCLRRKGQIDDVLGRCLDKTPPPPIEDLLRLGVAQLLFLAIKPHAVVDCAVELAKALGFAPLGRLVNAVLRRVADQGGAWVAGQDETRLNCPDWLWESWCGAYGEMTTRKITAMHLGEPPLDLTTRDAGIWADRLGAEILFTGSLRRPAGGAVAALPGFEQGVWWVQDAAASLPARLLAAEPGERILDLCAAPGGKTAQLALAGANVTALDRSPRRLVRLGENLARLGLTAETVVADAAEWQPLGLYDKVLLDAPCSSTGTLRRHPDVAWIKQPADIVKLAVSQDRLLAAAAKLVRPGGLLLYCTCSLQPEEGRERIEAFLAGGASFRREPIGAAELGGLSALVTPEGDLRTLPCHLAEIGGMDGFYAARLRRID
jgi:16S rRNA (cytosine967-C5)-methyltransferase